VEENGVVITSMIKLLRHPDSRIKRCTTECLLRFHDPTVISHWGPPTSLVANFWKISSQTMLLLARQILDSKQNEDTLNALLDLLSKILNARNLFLAKTLVKSTYTHTNFINKGLMDVHN
jgi:neurofibromin 1